MYILTVRRPLSRACHQPSTQERNERDLDELPDEVRTDLTFLLVDRIDDALKAALLPCKTPMVKPDMPAQNAPLHPEMGMR